MRKLKLESLQVESFTTTPGMVRGRGTVAGHADAVTGGDSMYVDQPGTTTIEPASRDPRYCGPETYDVQLCGDTRYFDCTFGCTVDCSRESYCHVCYADDSAHCAVK